MWKFDESYSTEEIKKFTNEFSERLLQLKGKIDQLKTISVHSNLPEAPSSNYDLMLDTSFDSIEDLNTYANHPDHVAVVEFSKPFRKVRSCVDFEY